MKIVLVSPYDYAFPGGVTKHVAALSRHLRRLGHEAYVMAPYSDEFSSPPENLISITGSVAKLRYGGTAARLTLAPAIYPRVRSILAQERFDVVHLHEPLAPGLPWVVLGQTSLYPQAVVVATFHAYWERARRLRYGQSLLERLYQRLDGGIAVSPVVRDLWASCFPRPLRVIPNGIEWYHFARTETQPWPHLADGKLNILFVGRLEPRKGLRYLLCAFERVKAEMPMTRLIVVGAYSGEEAAPFARWVKERGLQDVQFVGQVTEKELIRYYHTAHLFCAPSTGGESFGMVLLEAMAAGCPIVASDIVGYRTVLRHDQEGVLVPPADPAALAQALLRLLRDPAARRRLGRQGRVTAAAYAWERVSVQVLDYYRELMEHRRPARCPSTYHRKPGRVIAHDIGQRGKRRSPHDIHIIPPFWSSP